MFYPRYSYSNILTSNNLVKINVWKFDYDLIGSFKNKSDFMSQH